ncbi:hypothetical protein PVBG_03615 [Plasmodium vivax Brazil I]|uniref:RING-type domain-containing protein n=3 Tax=Plasmodium vivax TaxID=5855 RepID=A0A0J9U221_PLAVI|nr:hypothetical protein PVBG_03615 [Plasmodium vivax Brazil I]KNA02052.1 hypothetical protein PVNG_04166 [Plasmodium vivax North Korean]
MCSYILIDSHILVCSNNCGYSVCKTCILFYILNHLVVPDGKKTSARLEISKLKDNSVQCPLCKGTLRYCIWNKKLELTLKKIIEERKDIDSFKLNVDERNTRFLRVVEKLRIENFSPSGSTSKENILQSDVFQAIEAKYILSSANRKEDEPPREGDVKIANHFLYLMTNNRQNCTKEFNMIFLEFESPIFETVQKMSVRAAYNHQVGKTAGGGAAPSGGAANQLLHTNDNLANTRSGRSAVVERTEDDVDEDLYSQDKTYVMPISFVGGETSYSLIGVFCVKRPFKQVSPSSSSSEEVKQRAVLETFLQKWFSDEVRANQNPSEVQNPRELLTPLERLKSGDVYTLEWVLKYEKTCFFPARKQPIHNIINSRRQRGRKRNNIEIVLDLRKFLEVVLSVNNYIKYGSRPNNYETKKGGAALPSTVEDEEGKRKVAPTRGDNKQGDPSSWLHNIGGADAKGNQNDVVKERLASFPSSGAAASTGMTKQSEFQEIFSLLYNTRVPPVTIGGTFNVSNPYADYCALLPFLTKGDFLFLRRLQRIYKEKYLRQLYRHVRRNDLSMNIFFNAVNQVFFSGARWG